MQTDGPRVPTQSVFCLRIQLRDVEPIVWRRVLVPGSVRLDKLSEMLLAATGWSNSHPHAFRIGDTQFGVEPDEWPEDEIDETDVNVLEALREEQRFFLDYDFGDGWEHEVVIEELTWSSYDLKFAVCLDGQNACPPEDVGGTHGYADFVEAIANPAHEQHKSCLEWVGGSFDPAEFDLSEANARCQRVS
ncbi:MAG: plasmid pRiA4b ORF-3 family protein [Acidimicrobiales bacterium]